MSTRRTARVASIAALTFVLAISPYTRAAAETTAQIGDPVTDTVQLWTAIGDLFATAAHQLAIALERQQPAAATGNENGAQPASVGLAAEQPATIPSTDPAPASEVLAGSSSTPQPIIEQVVEYEPLASNGYITQAELTSQLQQLSATLVTKFNAVSASAPPLPQNVAADGNPQVPYAAENSIGNLSNVTISNANITASEIPSLDYLSLSGGSLAGNLILNGNATTTGASYFSGNIGIGTSTSQDALAVDGSTFLANVSAPSITTNRLYANGGSLYWAGNVIAGSATGNWTSDGTNAWRTGGNIGIGTTSPFATLSVVGNGYLTGGLTAASVSAINGTTTNATSTNLFSTFGNFTTGLINTLSGNTLTYIAASTTNATTTNLVAMNATTTNLAVSRASFLGGNLNVTGTSTLAAATITGYPFSIKGVSTASGQNAYDLYMASAADSVDQNGVAQFQTPTIDIGSNRDTDGFNPDQTAVVDIERMDDTQAGTAPYTFNSQQLALWVRGAWPEASTSISSTNAVTTTGGTSAGNHAGQNVAQISGYGQGDTSLEVNGYGGMIHALYVNTNSGYGTPGTSIFPKYAMQISALGSSANDSIGLEIDHNGAPAGGELFQVNSTANQQLFKINGPLNVSGGTVTAGGAYADLYVAGNVNALGGNSITIDPLTGNSNASIFLTARNGGGPLGASILANQVGALSLQPNASHPFVGINLSPSLGASFQVAGNTTIGYPVNTNVSAINGLLVSGSVGIGTTSPLGLLTVSDNTANPQTTAFLISSSTSNSTSTLFSVSNTGTTTISNGVNITSGCFSLSGTCLSLGSLSGTLGVSSGGTGSTTLAGLLLGNGAGAVNSASLGGSLSLSGSTLTDAWTLSGSNLYNNAGTNVGIGTTSPYAKLSISANSGDTNTTLFTIASSTGGSITTLFSVNNIGQTLFPNGNSNTLPTIASVANPNTGLNFNGTTIQFVSNGSQNWALNNATIYDPASASSVAINSAAPSGTSPNIIPNRSSTTAGIGASVAGNLSFITAAIDRLEVTSAGNVGIGTTTPYSRLEVWGPDTASTTAFVVANSASTTEFAVYDTGNATLAGGLIQNSDQRLKTNIQSLDASSSLSLIDQLNPVTFNWIDPNKGTQPQLGFIAQQVIPIFPNLVSTTSATALTPDGTLSLNYIDLISPIVSAIQALSSEIASIESTITGFAQSITSQRGIFTNELCVGSTCVTPAQFQAMVAASAASPDGGSSSPPSNSSASSTPDTPPVIQINGDNPAIVQIGSTYNDLGATITGPQADLNLGIATFLNGTLTSNLVIDTSQAATDTIDYVATDQNGLTSTSTRTVIIEAATSPSPTQ